MLVRILASGRLPVTLSADRRYLRRCLALAARGAGRTSPNPMVGCVLVGRRGELLAEGWHRRAGLAHAEADALAKLDGRAPGATLYVNLEPCAHTGLRLTAPCAPLVVASGISRLVYGMRDPFPGHGGGLAMLEAAGIEITGPVEEDACQRLNEAFVVYARDRRAHFTLKAAMTLDGRIATSTGESRWVTGEAARADVHRRRDRADAVLVGVGTVLKDDPQLTARGPKGRDPIRLVLDSRLRTPPAARIITERSSAPTILVATATASARREALLRTAGAEVWRIAAKDGRIDLASLARTLAERGIISVLVEGGAEVHAGFFAAHLCDRLLLYVAPRVMGGKRAVAWVGGADLAKL